MVDSIAFDFVIEVLVELPQFLDPVANRVLEVLEALRLLVAFAVDLQQRLVVGLNDVDLQIIALGTLRVVGPPTALVCAGHGESDHVAANRTDTRILLAPVNEMHPLDLALNSVIVALLMQHEATDVDELPLPPRHIVPRHLEPEVSITFGQS